MTRDNVYIILFSVSNGEVAEWLKALVLKTSDSARNRGFESHLLRHFKQAIEMFAEIGYNSAVRHSEWYSSG